jgi:hypothetical protein
LPVRACHGHGSRAPPAYRTSTPTGGEPIFSGARRYPEGGVSWTLIRHGWVRKTALTLFVLAFLFAAIAGVLGSLIAGVAPVS